LPETHDNEDAVVGFPTMANESLPFLIWKPELMSATITKELVAVAELVEKVYVKPPLDVVNEFIAAPFAVTLKSEARAVTAPLAAEAEMVHEIGALARTTLAPGQARLDTMVGLPKTVNV